MTRVTGMTEITRVTGIIMTSITTKVPRQEPSDADNDSAVYDDSPAETRLQIYLS